LGANVVKVAFSAVDARFFSRCERNQSKTLFENLKTFLVELKRTFKHNLYKRKQDFMF